MLKRIFILSMLFVCFSVAAMHSVTFESAEHVFIGDQIKLKDLPPSSGHTYQFTLPNGLQLSYGDILAMPDYYGDPNQQISTAATFTDRQHVFEKTFSDFAKSDKNYFLKFWPIIQDEQKQVIAALKQHQSVSALYKKIGNEEEVKLALATNLKYIALAANDYDHFGKNAVLAYQAGHAVAIAAALKAYAINAAQSTSDNQSCSHAPNFYVCLAERAKQQLLTAYEENAYACHFLSDRFAGGHIRTPLSKLLTTRPIPLLAALSAHLMHNEDNQYGVIVKNANGQYWMAYGDDYYFSAKNKSNRQMIQAVLQKSADEIAIVYEEGYDPDPDSQELLLSIPEAIAPGSVVNVPLIGPVRQSSPLYRTCMGLVCQRIDINNRYDNEWTPFWTSVATLLNYHLLGDQPTVPKAWKLLLQNNGLKNR